MSILIKGMEMPKSCMNCMFCGFAGADCELDLCQITGNAQKHIPYSKMPDCPLIEISSADVAPVAHGKWICHDDELLGLTTECSVCHVEGCLNGHYCPNCGAKMDLLN